MSAEHVGAVQCLGEQCRLNLFQAQLYDFKYCAMNMKCKTAVFMCNRTTTICEGLQL
jgi:hypothetical protein